MKWYPYLKSANKRDKSLLNFETVENDNFIVCQKLQYLQFGRFLNFLDFGKYMNKNVRPEERCFYEIVFGEKKHRIYFDIEFFTQEKENEVYLPIEEADESIRYICDTILLELKNILKIEANPLKANNSHIMVFTSHANDKRSYHIVVEGYTVSNNKENREFYDRIVKRLPDRWKPIIDHSMYKSVQQFRIAGNTKWGASRVKTLSKELTLNYQETTGWIPKVLPESSQHEIMLLLEASLLGQSSNSTNLPSITQEKKEKNPFYSTESNGEFNPLTPEDIELALKLCYTYANLPFGDPRFPYSYLSTVEESGNSALILLKRHHASNCPTCKRIHEHENPYLIIAGENRDVYLDCRRHPEGRKLHVGCLGGKEKPSSPKKTENDIIIPETKIGPLDIEKFKKYAEGEKSTKNTSKSWNDSSKTPIKFEFNF